MRHSIRSKMIIILITIVGSVLCLTLLLNSTFAESYYVAIEKSTIISSFLDLKKSFEKVDLAEEDSNGYQELYDLMEEITNRSNTKIMVARSGNDYYDQEVIFSNMTDGTKSYEEILAHLNILRREVMYQMNMADGKSKKFSSVLDLIEENNLSTLIHKGYYVTQLTDHGMNGIYLFGFTDNDYLVAMKVSIEGIRASLKISSHFMAYMGTIAIFLGIIAVSVYAYSFTKPIKEMANVANRMTELDFNARVESMPDDELGELGNSINILSDALKGTIADLKAANLELQQDIQKKEEIDEMRKEFVSHVSHELKTPIAIIQGYAEGLKDGVIDDQESMDFYCEVIMDEANKMNQMVRKLLTLNQLEFGNTPLNIAHFDITQMIENKLANSQILFSGHDVTLEFNEKEAYVWADEFMIEEVFSNYLTNAKNHVTDGGKIRIWYERMEKGIRILVYNQGNPIPESELEKLWIKFYKVDKARTREYGGNGIGLSIVAAAMKAHKKDFGVYNVEDGVVFYFDLDTEKSASI